MKKSEVKARVLTILVTHKKGKTRFSKPKDSYVGYSVRKGDTKKAAIHVDPKAQEFPVYLQFASNRKIKAVGFAECKSNLRRCTKEGWCGGCFYLLSDFNQELKQQKVTPQIQNDGHNPRNGYHFRLWLKGKNGIEQEISIDPQIYNQGDTEPPGKKRKK